MGTPILTSLHFLEGRCSHLSCPFHLLLLLRETTTASVVSDNVTKAVAGGRMLRKMRWFYIGTMRCMW
jgi:hypothetical protein